MNKKTEIKKLKIFSPFNHSFLKTFYITPGLLPWKETELLEFDKELNIYEQGAIDSELEKGLIDRNELLISYAISKAEDSSLTMLEAQDVRQLLLNDSSYDFLSEKLKNKKRLTKKDHDELEFFNIVKVFRKYRDNFSLDKLTPELILKIHAELTAGLDIFVDYLPKSEFDVYKSGKWRDNNSVRVGTFIPAPHKDILSGVKELVLFIKKNPGAINVAIFHSYLYALHPFCNGNKRVCRILEYLILHANGYDKKNLYNVSYYYHKHKDRYYKNLLVSLSRRNFNFFLSFLSESLFFSIAGIIKTSLERKKRDFLNNSGLEKEVIKVLRPLIKRQRVQFNRLWALNKRKPSKQTFSNYLGVAVEGNVLLKEEVGRNTYYSLKGDYLEINIIHDKLESIKGKIDYIPEEFRYL